MFMPEKKSIDYVLYIFLYIVLFFLAANLSSRALLRGELVKLPNLVGKNFEEARTEILKKNLSISVQSYQPDSTWEKGRIIYQDPMPGSRLRKNKVVKVVISEGSEKVDIPRVEGRSLEAATQILKDSGLRKGRISQIHTPQFSAGRILAQEPRPSVVVDRNTPVNLLISQGAWEDRFMMPDLIEKNADKVIDKLRSMDFKVSDIHYSYYPGLGPGIIIKQFPPPGFRIQKRNLITLEVSR
jgi:serine/threonine-protein kinase